MQTQKVCIFVAYFNTAWSLTNSAEFLVNGTGIPEVNFDVGESYAGTLPNTPAGNSSLFFWFFPSKNPNATDEVSNLCRAICFI